jgi:hypothetical protein
MCTTETPSSIWISQSSLLARVSSGSDFRSHVSLSSPFRTLYEFNISLSFDVQSIKGCVESVPTSGSASFVIIGVGFKKSV